MREPWPIIVAGFYRSGTSLLRRLLDAHSRIHCGPEVKFFKDFFGEYRDDPLAHARLFTTLRSLGIGDDIILDRFGHALLEVYEYSCRQFGKPRWADKNPENLIHGEHWHRLLAGRMYFVHIVREPLDAIASLLEIGFERTVPPGLGGKLGEYQRFMDAGAAFEERHPEICRQLRYEDLVRTPNETLKTLLTFVGEVFEPGMLTGFAHSARRHGIEDPKVATTTRIHTDSIGRYRQLLTGEQQAQALLALDPYYARYGYPLPERRPA